MRRHGKLPHIGETDCVAALEGFEPLCVDFEPVYSHHTKPTRRVCLMCVEPLTAELWDGPASTAVAAFEFAKARLTGEKPNLGENRKVTVKM